MAELRCRTWGFVVCGWYDNGSNEAAPGVNLIRPLTRSSGTSREGLAMKATRKKKSVAERLARRLRATDAGCLEWTVFTDGDGYGVIAIDSKPVGAHRVAWELANGPIPDGLLVCHHCDNPPCCQTEPTEGYPDGHLFLGTHADNAADKVAKGRHHGQQKTHCKAGHRFTEANTYVRANGVRNCRACATDRIARHRAVCGRTDGMGHQARTARRAERRKEAVDS